MTQKFNHICYCQEAKRTKEETKFNDFQSPHSNLTLIRSDLAYNDSDLVMASTSLNPNGLRPPSMVQIGSRPQQPPAYVISATANGNGHGHSNNRQEDESVIHFVKYHSSPLP